MEKLSLNEQIKNAFHNPQDKIISLLKYKTNAFLENYISENYIEKEIAKDCLTTSYNWWTGNSNGKKYAIHIDDAIRPIDIAFSKELRKANFEIIFININEFEKEVSFIYENNEYNLETLVKELSLKEVVKTYELNKNVNSTVFDWCYRNLDYKKLIYHGAIEMLFLSRYFEYLTNLDVVWSNEINGQVTFFIGEVKFKSKNKNNVFIMNIGEKILYENIIKKTNIQVVAIALVCNREDRQSTLVELMNNKEFPIFYMPLNKNDFENLTIKDGKLSDFDKQNGKKHQNTIDFPFQKFERVLDFSEIGKENKTFVRTLNKVLIKYSHLLYGDRKYCQKHIAKFYALFDMMKNGFDIDYNDYLNEDSIRENILIINGYKVLFKFVESYRSWNVTLEQKEFDIAKEKNVDFILVYQNTDNGKDVLFNINQVEKNGQVFYLVDEKTSNNVIKILGCIPFKVFDNYKHCLNAGIPKSQINYYAARGLNGYKTNMNDQNHKSNQDTYFLQILGCKRDGTDKEPKECQLEVYDKTKNLPFISSYVFY